MLKLVAPLTLTLALALAGCSTSGPAGATNGSVTDAAATATPTPTPTPVVVPDLGGEWKQNNSKSTDGWVTASITADVITVDFVTDAGDTSSLFWVGTYAAPTDDTSPYTWTSTRDEAATETALLASTDPTKDFTYADEEISFPITIAGSTATVRLSKS